MCMLTLIAPTMSGTLLVSDLVHGCVRWISLKGRERGQVSESRTPFTFLSWALFGHSELGLE